MLLPLGAMDRAGYMTDAVELWRDAGEKPDDEAPGDWPAVYEEGGETAGVPVDPVDDRADKGDAIWAADAWG